MTTRDVTYIAIFGALWGALEISVGTWLHALNVPLKGLIMSGMGLTVALAGRQVVARNGSLMAITAIAAVLKALSFGGIILAPLTAILIQGGIAEVATIGAARPARWRMALAGALAVVWNVFHPILGQGDVMGMSPTVAWAALGALVLLHLIVGAAAGMMAMTIATGAMRRLRPQEAHDGR